MNIILGRRECVVTACVCVCVCVEHILKLRLRGYLGTRKEEGRKRRPALGLVDCCCWFESESLFWEGCLRVWFARLPCRLLPVSFVWLLSGLCVLVKSIVGYIAGND